ncbi:hypothetical protein GGF42_008074 [Coemansia sp. RSA 2424]|nr:hypothetical protein GGF42_008074 [Coemansia sp. RSA 2424]
MVGYAMPDYLRHIALDILQLDHVDWMHINTLSFDNYYMGYDFSHEKPVASEADEAEVARTMQYFGHNVCNIAELNLLYHRMEAMVNTICSSFATMYGGQLQIIRARGSVPLSISHLSRHIAVLELALDSSAARVLPSICGETLRVLKLSSVPRNFAWHHFRYDVFVRPIVFPQLATLSLSYSHKFMELTKDEVQSKIISGALNCDQLCFPVLKSLTINSCTPDCDLLYADTPFPGLEKVDLSGTFDEIHHCTRLKLIWVGDLRVEINSSWDDLAADIYNVTNHFFSAVCIGRTARLDLNGVHAPIDPELIRWTNLTYLRVKAVSYETLCKLIARLPNLTGFQTTELEFSTIPADTFSVDESLFRSTDPLLAWGAKLATIIIWSVSDNYPEEARVIAVQALVLHAGALKKFAVPWSIKSSLAAFIDEYKNRYPHLTDIVTDIEFTELAY